MTIRHQTVPLVGAHFRPPAKALLQVLPAGTLLRLEAEPSNQFDPNAIKVLAASAAIPLDQHDQLSLLAAGYGVDLSTILDAPEWHLGYVKATEAAVLISYINCITSSTLSFAADGKPTIDLTLTT